MLSGKRKANSKNKKSIVSPNVSLKPNEEYFIQNINTFVNGYSLSIQNHTEESNFEEQIYFDATKKDLDFIIEKMKIVSNRKNCMTRIRKINQEINSRMIKHQENARIIALKQKENEEFERDDLAGREEKKSLLESIMNYRTDFNVSQTIESVDGLNIISKIEINKIEMVTKKKFGKKIFDSDNCDSDSLKVQLTKAILNRKDLLFFIQKENGNKIFFVSKDQKIDVVDGISNKEKLLELIEKDHRMPKIDGHKTPLTPLPSVSIYSKQNDVMLNVLEGAQTNLLIFKGSPLLLAICKTGFLFEGKESDIKIIIYDDGSCANCIDEGQENLTHFTLKRLSVFQLNPNENSIN